jgi:tripartite ATP-independent transporter DctM subunit
MEWWTIFLFLFCGFVLMMLIGLPVAFSFLLLNVVGSYAFMGGVEGVKQLTFSIYGAVANFVLTPIVLFILMGEIIFNSGIALKALNVLDKFLGRIPGRLSILAVASSTLFSGLTGSAVSNTALLGSMLLPEMKRRGYGKSMMIGPIIGTGGLAMMMPPSALAVVLGSVAHISIAGILMGGILPGFIMASLYTFYIIVKASINPSVAPAYEMSETRALDILKEFSAYVLPLFVVALLVIGPIYGGIATPTEAASLGCLGSVILAICYGRFNVKVLIKSMEATVRISCMAFMIIAGSVGYSQIIAFTGAGQGMIEFVTSLSLSKTMIIILMLSVLLMLGCFMDQMAMIMVTIPFYMPIVCNFNIEPVWFAIMVLITLDVGFTSPPFGLLLFVMKGIAPPDISMIDIYKAAIPFIICNIVTLLIIFVYPKIVLYLPRIIG